MFVKELKNLKCPIVETHANALEMMILQVSNYAFNDELNVFRIFQAWLSKSF